MDGTTPEHLRAHQNIKCIAAGEILPAPKPGGRAIALIGFCVEEGVRRNQGRLGSAEGPTALRRALSSLPVPAGDTVQMVDLGDILCPDGDLEGAQAAAAQLGAAARQAGYLPVFLGGGHEVAYAAWASAAGLRREGGAANVFNLDAHWDLRPYDPAAGLVRHSGNSFSAMAAEAAAGGYPFAYHVAGLQRMGNTAYLSNRAEELKATHTLAEDVSPETCADLAWQWANAGPLQLTVCLDVFSLAVAPGVSAPAPLGIWPSPHVVGLLRALAASPHLLSIDIAELSPAHDVDVHSARLAAALVWEMIFAKSG